MMLCRANIAISAPGCGFQASCWLIIAHWYWLSVQISRNNYANSDDTRSKSSPAAFQGLSELEAAGIVAKGSCVDAGSSSWLNTDKNHNYTASVNEEGSLIRNSRDFSEFAARKEILFTFIQCQKIFSLSFCTKMKPRYAKLSTFVVSSPPQVNLKPFFSLSYLLFFCTFLVWKGSFSKILDA